MKKDGKEDEQAVEKKYRWDEENRLLASDENGFVANYLYDADGERTVKSSGEGEQIYVNCRASREQSQACLSFAKAQPTIICDNSEFSGGVTNTAKFSLYVSPYLVASQGGKYTKHIYIGSQRIVSKLGDLASYGADPRRIPYAGTEADGVSVDYQTKYNRQQQAIKDNYADFGVPYNGEDNNDYVNGEGFCCNDGTPTVARAKAARSIEGNFKPNDDYEKMQFYYHPDHLGSSSYITNLDGEVVQHIEYVPFGEVFIEERNNTWNTPYLFNAKEYDEETGMYYYGARYYDPRISFWISADKKQEEYPNFSTYTFSANSPINYVDPDGNVVIFVNGYYNTRKGAVIGKIIESLIGDKGGRSYWGQGFINNAVSYFNDRDIMFVDGRGAFNSSGESRFNAGYKYAQEHYSNILSHLEQGEKVNVVSHSMGSAYAEGIIQYLLEQGVSMGQIIHFSPADPADFSASHPNTLQLNINNDIVLSYKNALSGDIINGVSRYGLVKTSRSFVSDILNSHADTKYDGNVWNYVKALNSMRMQKNGTETYYKLSGGTLAPTYIQISREIYKAINNGGTIFKTLQINGQFYENNGGNTYFRH